VPLYRDDRPLAKDFATATDFIGERAPPPEG